MKWLIPTIALALMASTTQAATCVDKKGRWYSVTMSGTSKANRVNWIMCELDRSTQEVTNCDYIWGGKRFRATTFSDADQSETIAKNVYIDRQKVWQVEWKQNLEDSPFPTVYCRSGS